VSPCRPSTSERRPLRRTRLLLCALQIATATLVVKSSSTPPLPQSGRHCLYLTVTLLGLPPPLHDFDDHNHIDLGYLGIKGLSSACGTRRFSTPVTAFTPSRCCNCRGCQFVGFYLRLIVQSHHLWCSRCDCGGY
jgi:hypothetical protein